LPAPPPELLLLLLLLLSPPLLLLIFTLVGASEIFPDFAVAPAAGGAALDAAGGLVNSQLVAPPCASERCTKPDASAADIIFRRSGELREADRWFDGFIPKR
jgi:hypothetical protein